MSEFIQIHALWPYAASNPNRGRDNEPKTVEYGGFLRLRMSSPCQKAAWRMSDLFLDAFGGALGREHMGLRTREFGAEIHERLAKSGFDEDKAVRWAQIIAAAFGALKPRKDGSSEPVQNETLFFFSPREIGNLDSFVAAVIAERREPPNVKGKEALEKAGAEIRSHILVPEAGAVDIALFGRMFAHDKAYSVEAACQVAHAFTVNAVDIEDDVFVARDDKRRGGAADESTHVGSAHLSSHAFGSGIYYLYVTIDRTQLERSLGRPDLARLASRTLTEAVLTVPPRGKINWSAHHGRAFYGRVERGERLPRSLALAYLSPVGARNGASGETWERESVVRLRDLALRFDRAYGPLVREVAEMNVLGGEGTLAELLELAGK